VTIMSPAEIGGIKSNEYRAINPQEKVPALKCTTTGLCIAESDTIARYLLSEYAHIGPSFHPNNPIANMMARLHDVYLSPIQTCLYKPGPPFGALGTRKDALTEYSRQLGIIANYMVNDGPYLCGDFVSIADATLFPSIVFASHFFPKFDSGLEQPIPAKIEAWFQGLIANDSAFSRVYDEVRNQNT
jgi:glutathione S-transferase